jgi:hypothetical protein
LPLYPASNRIHRSLPNTCYHWLLWRASFSHCAPTASDTTSPHRKARGVLHGQVARLRLTSFVERDPYALFRRVAYYLRSPLRLAAPPPTDRISRAWWRCGSSETSNFHLPFHSQGNRTGTSADYNRRSVSLGLSNTSMIRESRRWRRIGVAPCFYARRVSAPSQKLKAR